MKFLAPALTIFLAASSSVATPSGREGTKESRENTTRYHFPEDKTECVTHLVITDYLDKRRRDGESWYCEFSPDTAKNYGGIQTMAIKGLSGEELTALGAVSGKTILRLDTSARITEEFRLGSALQTAALHIQDNSNVQIEMMDSETDTRHVDNRQIRVDKKGRMDTLVIRVIDRNSNAPPSDLGAIFSDELSLSNQIRDCSYNQMNVQPATQFSSNGIIDMRIDMLASEFGSSGSFGDYAKSVAKQKLGSSYDRADLVIYCLPEIPGLDWAGYAWVFGHESFYNNRYCDNHEVLLHEVGHNMGLGHSGQDDEEYGDFAGTMGAPYSYGKMCFNPAKSYQLGWYSKQVKSINPLDFPSVQTYFLNGVADYKSDGSNGSSLVVLRIENPRGNSNGNNDYYIGYNRKTGINSATAEAADMVTITTQGGDPNGPISLRIADLRAGDSFDEFSLNVEFTLSVVSIEGKTAKIEIRTSSVPNVQPTQPPVQPPTRTPSKAPAQSPTRPTSDCDGAKLQIELLTDDYGSESVWYLYDYEEGVDLTPGLGQNYGFSSNTVYWLPSRDGYHCLEKGKQYGFWMGDASYDGMCCTHGDGYFKLWLDGELIHTGGQFLDYDEVVIDVPDNGLPSPTPQPTPAQQPQNSCTDDLSFRFKNKSKKSCQWIGKKKKKTKKMCKKNVEKGSSEKVSNRCRETCAAVGLGPCAN